MATFTKHICDLCGANEAKYLQRQIQCAFDTEQTEGRSTTPYLSTVDLDLCDGCLNKIIVTHSLWASGVMGYNRYRFKQQEGGGNG